SSGLCNYSKIGKLEFFFELFEGNIEESFSIEINIVKAHKKYYSIDTHVHTKESDGQVELYEIKDVMKKLEREAFFTTDHNNINQNVLSCLKNDIVVYPGMELTTRNGHINILGKSITSKINLESKEIMYKCLKKLKGDDVLVSLNHPFADAYTNCYFKWGLDDISPFDTLEVWNNSWFCEDDINKSFNQMTLDFWQEQLCSGKKLFVIAGSDFHSLDTRDMHGEACYKFYPTLNVESESLNLEDMIISMKRGNSYITKLGEKILFETSFSFGETYNDTSVCVVKGAKPKDVLKIVSNDHVEEILFENDIVINFEKYANCKFLRFEVWRFKDKICFPVAITNPIFKDDTN
ncbi:MAG: CehA/McbA family metallohydrolase, partial [Bacilli bacterium]